MKEFGVSVMPYFDQGLRSTKSNQRSAKTESSKRQPGCIRSFNTRIDQHGRFGPYEPVIIPFTQGTLSAFGIDFRWPFPQLLRGKKWIFLTHHTRVFLVNTLDWSLYELDTLTSYPASGSNFSIKQGHQWQLIDFWDTWLLTNGQTTVFHANFDLMVGNADKMYISNNIRINAGCAFNGRSWMGGFDPEFFHSNNIFPNEWENFYKNLADDVGEPSVNPFIDVNIYAGLDENFVLWSTIGGGDLFQLWNLSTSQDGWINSNYGAGPSPERHMIFDLLKRNESGRMPMPWQGAVRHMKPLGKHVVVYGDGGVSVLAPSGSVVGLIDLHIDQGIANTGAVGGNDNEHVFLDGAGALWHLAKDLTLQRLDFREYMRSFLGTEVIISYSSAERQFYICNGNRGFLLSSDGKLTEHGQQVTSAIDFEGAVLGLGTDESFMNKDMEVITDTLTPGLRGNRMCSFIDIYGDVNNVPAGNNHPTVQVGVDFKYKMTDNFRSSRYTAINDFGVGRVGVAASELRIKVKSSDFRDMNIEDVVMKYQVPDKRFMRGIMEDNI